VIEHETDLGTTRISARALTRLAAAVAASYLDLAPDKIGVTVDRPDGRVEFTVSAPLPAATMIDRVQEQIRVDTSDLIGSSVGRVSVRESSAPQAAALAGTILTQVRTRYRKDPVRLVGLVAVGLTSVGVLAGILVRAIFRK